MIFNNKKVDKVIATFTKTIKDLETIAQANEAEYAKLEEEAAAIKIKQDEAAAEANKAIEISKKLNNLFKV